MDTYYKPEDLGKFEEIGKEAPELATSSVLIALMPLRKPVWKRDRRRAK
jgi:hypothetical protein